MPKPQSTADSPDERAGLVAAEVEVKPGAEEGQDPGQVFRTALLAGGSLPRQGGVGMLRVPQQHLRNLFYRQHVVGRVGGDRAPRHAIMLSGGGLLDEGNTADRLDLLQAERAVGAAAGEDDADGPLLLILGQRPEEKVDRHVRRSSRGGRREPQDALADTEVAVRRDHVDVVSLDRRVAGHLPHGHLRVLAQQLGGQALVGGIEMLDHHERHAAVGRHGPEEADEGFEAAGRGAHAHNHGTGRLPRLLGGLARASPSLELAT